MTDIQYMKSLDKIHDARAALQEVSYTLHMFGDRYYRDITRALEKMVERVLEETKHGNKTR